MADDVVDVIKAQHREVDRLLEEAMSEGSDRAALLRQVSDLLTPHSEAEESFVYPAIREYDESEADEVRDGTAEHHHVEEEEEDLLPVLSEKASDDEREELGARFAEVTGHEGDDVRPASELTRDELYRQAREQGVEGRSSMSKEELAQAVEQP